MPLPFHGGPPAFGAGASPLPSAPRRSGELYIRPDVPLAIRRTLAIAAAEAAVPLDIAGTLICEASLLLERLTARRVRHAAALLDQAASSNRVARTISAANADYLRALGCRSWRRHRGELDLPARVLAQLDGRELETRLACSGLLEQAIRWEMGALLAGRTMGSWGTEVVLAGFRRSSTAGRAPSQASAHR